jgi:acyl carrier protein
MSAEQILDIIRKSLRLPKLTHNDRMGSVVGWDSLQHIRLMLQLEKEFKVKIPTHQLGGLTSVAAIVAYFTQSGSLAA